MKDEDDDQEKQHSTKTWVCLDYVLGKIYRVDYRFNYFSSMNIYKIALRYHNTGPLNFRLGHTMSCICNNDTIFNLISLEIHFWTIVQEVNILVKIKVTK